MNKKLLIKDLRGIVDIMSMNRDMFKEDFFFEMLSMFRQLVKDIKGDKYGKDRKVKNL